MMRKCMLYTLHKILKEIPLKYCTVGILKTLGKLNKYLIILNTVKNQKRMNM